LERERQIRWGILGPGKIAHKFADAFREVPQATLYALASRDARRGREFARQYAIGQVYQSYEALVADPQVDAIYVATPHPFHHAQTLLCLNSKKAVLCEKPLTMNYRQTADLVAAARQNNTFLMEGMWSRFFPALIRALEIVRQGTLGEVKLLEADFGFASPFDPGSRVFNLSLGGGAQLDVGVYPMFLALLMLGKPDHVQALAQRAATGADETTSVQLHFRNGAIAHILSSVAAETPKLAVITGTKGTLTLESPWHKSKAVRLRMNSGETTTSDFPYSGMGFEYELREVTHCLLSGMKECPLMPLDFSLLMAETADEILRQCGITYSA
jgi:predicted dehydrogenase